MNGYNAQAGKVSSANASVGPFECMAKKVNKSNSTPDLSEVIRRLNPNVPAGQGDSAIPRTARDSNALRQLRTYVAADPYAKTLLTGHIGVGKSTELLHLAHEMDTARFVVRCSVAQTLGVHNVDTFSLLVVILEASIRSWVERVGELPAGLIEELIDHVRSLLPAEQRPAKTQKARSPLALAMVGPEASLAQVMRGLLTEVYTIDTKKGSASEQLVQLYAEILQRLALRYVPEDELVNLDVSGVALSCEAVLKELAHKIGKPVLLIIDDLDKVRHEGRATEVFLDRAMAWMRLPCAVVATSPLEMIFSAKGAELDHVWGEVQILDPFPVPDSTGTSSRDPALKPYLSMLRSVNAHEVFSALQCRKLACASSGLPRSFIYACSACVRYAVEAGESHVRDYHVELVQRDLTDRWRGRLNDSDYDALIAVLDSGGSNVPRAIELLRDGLLIRDGNARDAEQFRLPSWIVPLVEAHRKRHAG